MSELAERVKEIRKKAVSLWYSHDYGIGRDDALEQLIEQALLAERRSVWATAIEAIQNKKALPGLNRVIAISALRAAAEKEVSK